MRIAANSIKAQEILLMLSTLQNDFMEKLQSISELFDNHAQFKIIGVSN